MHIARIRQDYYPVPPPPASARDGAGAASRSPGAAAGGGMPPAARVVEGEWQKGRAAADDAVFERVWRERQTYANEAQSLSPDARRAIHAYRDQAAFFDRPAPSRSRIDFYA